MVAARKRLIWMSKEERKEKLKEKTKGTGPCYRDLTISCHDFSHTEVREGCAALNKEEKPTQCLTKRFSCYTLHKILIWLRETYIFSMGFLIKMY